MKEFKKLTVNGVTYTVADPDAAHFLTVTLDHSTAMASHKSADILGAVNEGRLVVVVDDHGSDVATYCLSHIDGETAIFTGYTAQHKFVVCTIGDDGSFAMETVTIGGSVLYDKQTLTNKQKTQARENIGAIGADHYTNYDRAGLVRIPGYSSGGYGLKQTDQSAMPGGVVVACADDSEIAEKKSAYKPIVPAKLDYAVMQGVAYNSNVMNAAMQKRACKWLGTLHVVENDDGSVTVTLPSGKTKTVDLSLIEKLL